MADRRVHKMTIRLTEKEMKILHAVADGEGLNISEWIRMVARLAYAQLPSKKRSSK